MVEISLCQHSVPLLKLILSSCCVSQHIITWPYNTADAIVGFHLILIAKIDLKDASDQNVRHV